MDWIALSLLAALLGKLATAYLTLEDAARRMAAQHGLGRRARFHYQDRLIPRTLPLAIGTTALLLVLDAALIARSADLSGAVLALGAAGLLPWVFHRLPPRRGTAAILRLARRRLLRRSRGGCATARQAGNIAAQLLQAHPALRIGGGEPG